MSRGPFQGTYQPNLRPVVVTAPDAIVLINQNSRIVACPSCSRSFDINKYITSITVDLSVDSVPGSASIALSVPRHSIDDIFFDGSLVISPMMEVNIYAKGFYLVNGLPQYYPIFWGLVTEASEAYSSGEHTVSIHCSDILKWWELCRVDINSAYTSIPGTQPKGVLNGNSFSGKNPYDIIWTLAQQGFGDIVTAGGNLITNLHQNPLTPSFNMALYEAAAYWQQRFQAMSANLMIYGSAGSLVRGDQLQRQMRAHGQPPGTPTKWASSDLATGTGEVGFDPSGSLVTPFHTNNTNLSVNLWQSEYQTKLEIANACKEAIGYEFFMDVTGDIVFKPPFYNLDILSNKPVSWIQDIDVIEWDLSDSESEVITQLTLGGNFSGNTDWGGGADLNRSASVTDFHLLRKYGWRTQQIQSEFLGNDQDSLIRFGLDMLDKINAKRNRGTVTIPFRPEMRLGFPVYLASKDQIWYVQGISHNLAFGGRATTSLTLTAKREKFKAPQGICKLTLTKKPTKVSGSGGTFDFTGPELSAQGSFKLESPSGSVSGPAVSPIVQDQTGASANSPYLPIILRNPQTGRVLGYPNVVMAYYKPNQPSQAQVDAASGRSSPAVFFQNTGGKNLKTTSTTVNTDQSAHFIDNQLTRLNTKHLADRTMFGFTSAGTFVYAHDVGSGFDSPPVGVISDYVNVSGGRLTTTLLPGQTAQAVKESCMIRPVSDERGFEVIGHYRYGRGLSLSDGQMIQSNGTYQQANVSIQMALSGNLLTALTAQSQGLTPQSGFQYNPANSLATLTPEIDLATSGLPNTPSVPTPLYGNAAQNFISNSPVTNPAQAPFGSVEAAQLSQGLTLAEMTVLDPPPTQVGSIDATHTQCMCLMGRSDLAFMNQGYSVKTLPPVTGDTWTQPPTNQVNTAAATLTTTGSNVVSLDLGITPDDQIDQVTTAVDTFLWNLYQTLDTTHQQYEQRLRGGIYQAPQNGQGQAVNPTATNLGATAPPFSAPNRFGTGDPTADIQMASSAASNLTKAWNTFGTTLQATMNIGTLTQQISSDSADLQVLQAQLAKVQSGALAGSAGYNLAGVGPTSVAELQAAITKLEQKIASEELQLGQARNAQAQAGPVPNTLGG